MDSCIVPVILSAGHTAQMNAVADSFAMSLYPDLTAKNQGLLGWSCNAVPHGRFTTYTGKDSHDPPLQPYVELYRSNAQWLTACGRNCPARIRRFMGMRGVGFLHWGEEDSGPSRWQEMADIRWGWRIASKCSNSRCMYRTDRM
jgi:hypothetical protein